jgi:RNA-directed DNA polymerase
MHECLVNGTREAPEAVKKDTVWERRTANNPRRQATGESDEAIVVKKPANKISLPSGAPIAEPVERRASAKRNPDATPEAGTQRPAGSESWRARIRAAARKDKALRFNNLFHHLTRELLTEAYYALKRNAAPGVDGIDWKRYGEELPQRLDNLHERIRKGNYRPQPVVRLTRRRSRMR